VLFLYSAPRYIHFIYTYIHYHSSFISEGVAEVSQIFLQDAHVLQKLLTGMRNTADEIGSKPIAV
jgi:hypothetical protein